MDPIEVSYKVAFEARLGTDVQVRPDWRVQKEDV